MATSVEPREPGGGAVERALRSLSAPLGVALAAVLVAYALAVWNAPIDATQGEIQKILYVHPPLAFAAYLGFIGTAPEVHLEEHFAHPTALDELLRLGKRGSKRLLGQNRHRGIELLKNPKTTFRWRGDDRDFGPARGRQRFDRGGDVGNGPS